MKKTKLTLEIIIDKIEVDERYYDIDYHYFRNGVKKKGNLNSDYEGWTIKEFKKYLEDGGALKNALEEIAQL